MNGRMRHPSSEACRKVAQRFRTMAEEEGERTEVDMTMSNITRQPVSYQSEQCKTVACHAGFYVMARLAENRTEGREVGFFPHPMAPRIEGLHYIKDGQPPAQPYVTGVIVQHSAGMHWIARDLGFARYQDLIRWAEENPDEWGNPRGGEMFLTAAAFWPEEECYKMPHIDLHVIADWWDAVAERRQVAEDFATAKSTAIRRIRQVKAWN